MATPLTIDALPSVSISAGSIIAVVTGGLAKRSTVGDIGANTNFTQSGTGAVARTVQTDLREQVKVTQFGAVGDSTGIGLGTDDFTAISNAVTAAAGKILLFPYTGNGYRVGTNLTIPANVGVRFENKAVLYPDAGKTVTYTGLIGQSLDFTVGDRTEHDANGSLLNQFGSVFQITGGAGPQSISRVAFNAAAQTGGGGTNQVMASNLVIQQNAADLETSMVGLEIDVANNKTDKALNPAADIAIYGLSIISGGTKICGPAAIHISASTPATDGWRRGIFIPTTTIVPSGYAFDYAGNAGGASDFKVRDDGFVMIGTATVGLGSGSSYMLSLDCSANLGAVFSGSVAGNPMLNLWNRAVAGDNTFAIFQTEGGAGTTRGSITFNRAGTLTAYNTTSDYRLKTLSGLYADSGTIIDAIPIHLGRFNDALIERPMFVAHEVTEGGAWWAVTGEKDAVDDKGEIIAQQLDQSALVSLLWAEVQSLRKRLVAAGIA